MSTSFALREADRIRTGLGFAAPPIPVDRIARQLGLRIVREDLGSEVSGLLITNARQSVVVVNKTDHLHRRRFTVAHELGHFVLGHQFEDGGHVHVDRGNYISQRGLRASEGVDPKEIEANWFAASLLMPEDLLRSAVEQLNVPALLDHHVLKVSEQFRVSAQAMTIRLTTLGLL